MTAHCDFCSYAEIYLVSTRKSEVVGQSSFAKLSYDHVYNSSSRVVRPIISLKSNTQVSISGTAANPYIVTGI